MMINTHDELNLGCKPYTAKDIKNENMYAGILIW